MDAAIHNFRMRQQRRPSNLLHCMDRDGNIDAFRYIEYSKRRRVDFLKRANFICTMKSSLQQQRQQHQQRQQQLLRQQRPSSLSGMNTVMQPAMSIPPVVPSVLTKLPADLAAFGNAAAPSSAFGGVGMSGLAFSKVQGSAARRVSNAGHRQDHQFVSSRASSMPLPFASSFAINSTNYNNARSATTTTANKRNIGSRIVSVESDCSSSNAKLGSADDKKKKTNKRMASSSIPKVISSPPSPSLYQGQRQENRQQGLSSKPHRRLEKEELEAAEALLFGMGRDCKVNKTPENAAAAAQGRSLGIDKRNVASVSEYEQQAGEEVSKKRKIDHCHHGLCTTAATDDDAESSTIVSAEEETSLDNSINSMTQKCAKCIAREFGR